MRTTASVAVDSCSKIQHCELSVSSMTVSIAADTAKVGTARGQMAISNFLV
jgi:hypothetical protein